MVHAQVCHIHNALCSVCKLYWNYTFMIRLIRLIRSFILCDVYCNMCWHVVYHAVQFCTAAKQT